MPDRTTSRGITWLVIALVASLVGNALLAGRVQQRTEDAQALRTALAEAERALADVRTELRTDPTSDPIQRIAHAVEKLRGLTFKTPVEPELLSPAQFRERVRSLFLKETGRDEIRATERVLVALGVWPAEEDLSGTLQAVQEEQVAGFYDHQTRRLVVRASDATDPSPLDRVLLAHELTHALTDQHFDLSRLDALQDADADDQAEAYLALVEGDAQVTMQQYQRNVLTEEEQLRLVEEFRDIPSSRLDAAPPFLSESLSFPYTKGTDFVQALQARGGTALVDRAYADPPTSTEQILHPARYLDRRDEPVEIGMPDVAETLGWSTLQDGGFGELDVRLVADLGGGQGLPAAEARAAAQGWGGGAYVAVADGERTLVAALTAWDSEAEAREAARALERWLPLRFRNVGADVSAGSGRTWAGKDGAGHVARSGRQVLIIVGPSQRDVERARTAFPAF